MTLSLSLFQTVSLFLAMGTTLFVLVQYLVLVPLHKNSGAQRLAFLLTALAGLLVLTVARVMYGDYPGRLNVLAAFFYMLSAAMIKMGWHIWRDQTRGARDQRKREQAKLDHPSNYQPEDNR